MLSLLRDIEEGSGFERMHTVLSLHRDIEEGSGRPPVPTASGNVTGGVLCGTLAGTFSSPTFEIILIVQVRTVLEGWLNTKGCFICS